MAGGGELAGEPRKRDSGHVFGPGLDRKLRREAMNSIWGSRKRNRDRMGVFDGEGGVSAPASNPERDRGGKGVGEGPASIFTTTRSSI